MIKKIKISFCKHRHWSGLKLVSINEKEHLELFFFTPLSSDFKTEYSQEEFDYIKKKIIMMRKFL